MTVRETQEVMEAIGKIDIAAMDWQDQLIYMAAMSEMAERVKPLVVKYANRLPESSTFLLKLGSPKFPEK